MNVSIFIIYIEYFEYCKNKQKIIYFFIRANFIYIEINIKLKNKCSIFILSKKNYFIYFIINFYLLFIIIYKLKQISYKNITIINRLFYSIYIII